MDDFKAYCEYADMFCGEQTPMVLAFCFDGFKPLFMPLEVIRAQWSQMPEKAFENYGKRYRTIKI